MNRLSRLSESSLPSWTSVIPARIPRPTHRVSLTMAPTPIHPLPLSSLKTGPFTLAIKRDDLTGSTLTGNKVRKLEFLLADALVTGADSVLTCGGVQSNHCRATAIAARQLGLEPHLVLRTSGSDPPPETPAKGNLLLGEMAGARVVYAGKRQFEGKVAATLEALKAQGKSPYFIPVGGSNQLGMWGPFCLVEEMLQQGLQDHFDDLVLPIGSGGTAAAVAIGLHLAGSSVKVHAVNVSNNAEYFHALIDQDIQQLGLSSLGISSRSLVDIMEGYKGEGYGVVTKVEMDVVRSVATETGVFLDGVYTGKALRGLLAEITRTQAHPHPSRFRGKRILFIHTGGIFALHA